MDLTLAAPITSTAGQSIQVSYTAPAVNNALSNNAIQNTSGLDALSFSNFLVTNNSTVAVDVTAPTFASAAINTAGTSITVTFTDTNNLSSYSAPASAFDLQVDGYSFPITSVSSTGSTKTAVLALAATVSAGRTITLAYNAPTIDS